MSDALIQVALFPIPNVVAFPGTVVPLHVFEPRYRTMINESVEHNRMIGVCHTRKEIRSARKDQTVEEALKSNQATYDPHEVFSAGVCEIVDTTNDGRIYANVKMQSRLVLGHEVQTLPYRIVTCSELLDTDEDSAETALFQHSITENVLTMVGGQNPALIDILKGEKWTNLSASAFSYQVFQFLQFEADTMQSILEQTTALSRLQLIDEILTEVAKRRD